MLTANEISAQVVDACYHLHKELGPGLFESVYEVCLTQELTSRGLIAERQVSIPINYKGMKFEEGFRADILVNNAVILELKSVSKLSLVHKKQLLTYLKLSDKNLGLLLNFGAHLMKDGIHRIINEY